MPVPSHCTDSAGNVHVSVLGLLADVALAAGIRAGLGKIGRLATVSIDLGVSRRPGGKRLEGRARFEGSHAGHERQHIGSLMIRAPAGSVCVGAGTFMVLASKHPIAEHPSSRPASDFDEGQGLIDQRDLSPAESMVLRRADEAMLAWGSEDSSFLGHFLGFLAWASSQGASGTMRNELHVRNRYGHVQGGLLLGFAAT